jgi:four helix bundle protein
MAEIKSFRDWNVYKLALEQGKILFEITKRFPKEERFSLTDQIRRSSRAANAMLAESGARRRYPAAFANKLNQALGEDMDTQAWFDHARAGGYMTSDQRRELDGAWQHIGAMLDMMIQRADDVCPSAAQ